jgi:hypothetical protein
MSSHRLSLCSGLVTRGQGGNYLKTKLHRITGWDGFKTNRGNADPAAASTTPSYKHHEMAIYFTCVGWIITV